MSMIKVDRLSIGYDGIPVEKDISFTVNAGDYLCIVGENGSGKTTLMKTLLGLISPLGGSIVFNTGNDETKPAGKKVHKEEYSGLYIDPERDDQASGKGEIPENGMTESSDMQVSASDPARKNDKESTAKAEGNKQKGTNKPKNVKSGIGYLPQQTIVQRDFPASVREIVLSGCQGRSRFHPFYNKEEKALADRNMEKMGILQLKDRSYRELSGGQQQRVLLARALCATEKLLLLDEPVSGLDPKVTMEMYDLIRKLNDEGTTIIMITHDIKVATMYASHILHLGAKFFFGTTDEYLNSKSGKFFMLRQKGGVCL